MKRALMAGATLAFLIALWLTRSPKKLDVVTGHRHNFERIVALAPSYCETVVALGSVDKLVGISDHCQAEEAHHIAKVGTFAEANIEAILALNPDLVLAVPHVMAQTALQHLDKLGVAVFAHQPDSLADIRYINVEVARLLGVLEKGVALNLQLDKALEIGETTKSNSKTLIAIAHAPLVVAGSQTFVSEIIGRLGLTNMAGKSSAPWPIWSLEELLAHPPELIIIGEGRESLASYQRLFQQIGLDVAALAIRLIVPDYPIFSSPSPRLTTEIEYLAGLLSSHS